MGTAIELAIKFNNQQTEHEALTLSLKFLNSCLKNAISTIIWIELKHALHALSTIAELLVLLQGQYS